MNLERKNYNDTVPLRFIAIVIIVNSHMGAYYPVNVATGGGNMKHFVFYAFIIWYFFKPIEASQKLFYLVCRSN